MLETAVYAKRRGVTARSVLRWVVDLVGELAPGERRELENGELPEVVAVERTPGGHYRFDVRKKSDKPDKSDEST